jgi:2-C-methyl-D-erythritol 4-phosphate cytidylyltransferase
MLSIAVILPAAGQSKRFAATTSAGEKASKLTAEIGRKAVLVRSAELFANRPQVKQLIVAGDPDQLDTFKFRWADKLSFMGAKIVAGGRKERWETVLNALRAVEDGITHVAVHDAARPMADPAMIDRLLRAAEVHNAVIPALPIHATIKRVEDTPLASPDDDPLDEILGSAGKEKLDVRRIIETVPRAGLWTVQTPQIFELGLIRRAYEQITSGKLDPTGITDDAMLVEKLGEPVVAVEGDPMNIKITVPDDLKFAEAVLAMRSASPAKTIADPLGPKRKHPTWAQMDEE